MRAITGTNKSFCELVSIDIERIFPPRKKIKNLMFEKSVPSEEGEAEWVIFSFFFECSSINQSPSVRSKCTDHLLFKFKENMKMIKMPIFFE